MYPTKHRSEILRAVRLRGSCTIGELAHELDVSAETVRRHVRPLVSDGLVQKVHGGIVLPDALAEPPFNRRMTENAAAKQRIATVAAAQVASGESVMIDSGSTTAYVARALRYHTNLFVVTNGIEIARTLATRNSNRVNMAGGELRADDAATFGPDVLKFVTQFRVQHAILSVGAIDDAMNMMVFHLNEAEVARAYMEQAERTIVVADSSKLGRRGPVKICALDQADLLITDEVPSGPLRERLATAGVKLLVAKKTDVS